MANYQRNDPSSLSFGRRLAKAETEAATARQEVEALKKELPAAKQMQQAADVIKAQRTAAKQMIARGNSTVEELQGIDASVLTPSMREQLRHSINDAAYRQMDFQAQPFSFQTQDAELRFRNWQASCANQEQVFTQHNMEPPTNPQYQKWLQSQQSIEGRQLNALRQKQDIERNLMLRSSQSQQNKKASKADGFHLGGIKPLEQ